MDVNYDSFPIGLMKKNINKAVIISRIELLNPTLNEYLKKELSCYIYAVHYPTHKNIKYVHSASPPLYF